MDKQHQDGRNDFKFGTSKPNKRDFYNVVVIAPNGTVIDEHQWKKVAGNKEGGDLRKALKVEGWTPVRVFDETAYEASRSEFRDQNKRSTQESRQSVIQQAFIDAEVEYHPRIESALRIVLQLMDPSQEKRTVTTLRNVVRSIDAGMSEDARAKGKTKVSKGTTKTVESAAQVETTQS